MNKVFLIGRLTKDAELKYTPGEGKAVTTFNIALDDGFGEHKKTYFINVVVWGKTAEAVANYTHKGSKIAVQGKITTRSYDKDGTKRYITEVVADQYGGIEFLDSKKEESSSNYDYIQRAREAIGYDQDIEPVDGSDIPF